MNDPQLRLLRTVEMVPVLAFPYKQINNYLDCHHRTYIQYLIEADAVIHNQTLGLIAEKVNSCTKDEFWFYCQVSPKQFKSYNHHSLQKI